MLHAGQQEKNLDIGNSSGTNVSWVQEPNIKQNTLVTVQGQYLHTCQSTEIWKIANLAF